MKKIHWFTVSNLPYTLKKGDIFEIIDKEIIKQVVKVLRLQEGESILIKNEGCGYIGEIKNSKKNVLSLEIKEKKEQNIRKKVRLVFCIPKKDKFELILEKCTEIGVTDFYPVISDRTIKTHINSERALKIIQEASEQAQRLDTPILHPIAKLDDILEELKPVVFDVEGARPEHDMSRSGRAFLIGPEGGFSQRELDMFKEKKLEIYKIGETVLKTETAAIVVSGLLLN